jgi:lipoprotein-anchoring transpeptidase ErfK/SrfK
VKLIFSFFVVVVSLLAEQEIIVDLSEQMAYAYDDGNLVMEGRISSGKVGRETPTGEFRILAKELKHRSNLWPKPNGGAKMNYMMRLTNTGIAMHLGYVPNRPASHGCIRLQNGFAQRLFRWAKVGTPVYVEGDARDYLFEHGYRVDYYGDDEYSIDNISDEEIL